MLPTVSGPIADLVARCILAYERDGDGAVAAELATAPEFAATAREQLAALQRAGLLVPPDAPTYIGPYRVVRRLGIGGMGTVWLCEQLQPLRRLVAVKVMRPGLNHAELLARFHLERAALTTLDDPCIARILDAGMSAEQRPYLVMDYVPGTAITTWCAEHRPGLQQRLSLFTRICASVQHAHHKGIVHRDLKPSNILVVERDGAPMPVVIDFGVAKTITGAVADGSRFTLPGMLVGTPEYMSPEQARGTDVDTRTDVYSLGALLHELLTGQLPIDADALRRAVDLAGFLDEAVVRRPSSRLRELPPATLAQHAADRRTTPRELLAALRGDLDWITLRALEKDRERRYSTPAELGADVQRHLDGHPVTARPPSRWYAAQKFCSRHRLPVGLAAVALTSLLAATLTSVAFWRDAEAAAVQTIDANARLERSLESALTALDQMVEHGAQGLRNPANEAISRSLLRTALNLHEQWIDADAAAPTDDRLVAALATAMGRAAELHHLLGENDIAAELTARGERLLAGLRAGSRATSRVARQLGQAHLSLGVLRRTFGQADAAAEHFRAALDELPPPAPDAGNAHTARHWRIVALRELADTITESDTAATLRLFGEALPFAQAQIADPQTPLEERSAALRAIARLAWLQCELGAPEDAAGTLAQVVRELDRLAALPADLRDRLVIAPVQQQVLSPSIRLGDIATARRVTAQLEATMRAAVAAEPGITTHGTTLVRALQYRLLLEEPDVPDEAFLRLEREALDLERAAVAAAGNLPDLRQRQIASFVDAAARRAYWLGRPDDTRRSTDIAEASELLAEAGATWESLPATMRQDRHSQEIWLRSFGVGAEIAMASGDTAAAARWLERGIAFVNAAVAAHPEVLQFRMMRVDLLQASAATAPASDTSWSRLMQALDDLQQALPAHRTSRTWTRFWTKLEPILPRLPGLLAPRSAEQMADVAARLVALAPPETLDSAARHAVLAAATAALHRAIEAGLAPARLAASTFDPLRVEAGLRQPR